MCRIFYSLNQPNTESKIMRFLKQSDHLEKNTPGQDSASDHHTHPDGFGLAGWGRGKWTVYKSPRLYKEVSNLDDIVKRMAAHSLVIGHIRKCDTSYSIVKRENTHPFYYRNHVFLHNGYLREYAPKLRQIVPADLRQHIKGDTDSEIMFYLFLSILRKRKMGVETLFESVQELFRIMSSIVPVYNANIIYANKEYSLVTRYAHGRQDPPSLYWNRTDKGGVLITSEPVSRIYSIIPKNTVVVIHHATGETYTVPL
jgi:predicted glutamine amidotransferase